MNPHSFIALLPRIPFFSNAGNSTVDPKRRRMTQMPDSQVSNGESTSSSLLPGEVLENILNMLSSPRDLAAAARWGTQIRNLKYAITYHAGRRVTLPKFRYPIQSEPFLARGFPVPLALAPPAAHPVGQGGVVVRGGEDDGGRDRGHGQEGQFAGGVTGVARGVRGGGRGRRRRTIIWFFIF